MEPINLLEASFILEFEAHDKENKRGCNSNRARYFIRMIENSLLGRAAVRSVVNTDKDYAQFKDWCIVPFFGFNCSTLDKFKAGYVPQHGVCRRFGYTLFATIPSDYTSSECFGVYPMELTSVKPKSIHWRAKATVTICDVKIIVLNESKSYLGNATKLDNRQEHPSKILFV